MPNKPLTSPVRTQPLLRPDSESSSRLSGVTFEDLLQFFPFPKSKNVVVDTDTVFHGHLVRLRSESPGHQEEAIMERIPSSV